MKRLELEGQQFGKLKVICRTESRGGEGRITWFCRCECGGNTTATTSSLRKGGVQSCGCLRSWRFKSLAGQRFGRLVAVDVAGRFKIGNSRGKAVAWNCRCDCGNMKVVNGQALTGGGTRSCGCFRGDETRRRLTTHGMSKTREYRSWRSAVRRAASSRGTFSIAEVFDLYVSQGGKCVYCPATLPLDEMHRDHIVPLAAGGENTIKNIQLLCPTCNLRKWATMPNDFERKLALERSGFGFTRTGRRKRSLLAKAALKAAALGGDA